MITGVRLQKALPRVAALFATSWLLVATSAPPDKPVCAHESISVAFRTTGTCGPEGIMVVHVSQWKREIWIDNSQQIGLPPRGPVTGGGHFAPEIGEGHGIYLGNDCPMQLKNGNWEVYERSRYMRIWSTVDAGASADAALPDAAPTIVDGGRDVGAETPNRYRPWDTQDVCRAQMVSGKLELNCTYLGQPTCRSTLTPLQ